MKADVLTIVVMIFTIGVFVSGGGFISESNAEVPVPVSALQQGLVLSR